VNPSAASVRSARDLARLLLVIAVLAAPAIALAFTPLAPAVSLLFVGVIPGIVASLHGTRVAVGAVIGTGVLVLLVGIAEPEPWAAAGLMAVVGLTIGLCATRGWQTIATAACGWPATLLIASPFRVPDTAWASSGPGEVLTPALLALAGGLWAVLVGAVALKRMPSSVPMPLTRPVSAVYGIALAALLGATALAASTWFHGTTAGWALLTIFVVARPGFTDTNRRILLRSVGTIAGGLAAAAVAFLLPFHAAHVLLGAVALVAAIAVQIKKTDYAVYAFALTASVVLLNSAGADVLPVDGQRVLFTVAGAVLTAAVVAGLELAFRSRLASDRTRASAERPGAPS
jgi:hypothetical protein